MIMTFYKDNPIIVGLLGEAGVGKNCLADQFAPRAQLFSSNEDNENPHLPPFLTDQTAFATPLHKMAGARQVISGYMADDRIKYELHAILVDLFGNNPLYGAPTYQQLIEIVLDISRIYCEPIDQKPRRFLQDAAVWCRAVDADCFVKKTKRTIDSIFREHISDPDQSSIPLVVFVTDVRLPNEVDMIKSCKNGFILRLKADYDTRIQRLLERDGSVDKERLNHSTEKHFDTIDQSLIDMVIDNTDLTRKETAEAASKFIFSILGDVLLDA